MGRRRGPRIAAPEETIWDRLPSGNPFRPATTEREQFNARARALREQLRTRVAPAPAPFPVPQPMPQPTPAPPTDFDDLLDRPVSRPVDPPTDFDELLDRPFHPSGSDAGDAARDFEELMKRPVTRDPATLPRGRGMTDAIKRRLEREALRRAAMKFGVRALGPLGGILDIFTPSELGSGELPGGPGSANEPGDRLEDIIVDAVRLPKPKPTPRMKRMPTWPPEPPLIPAKPSKGVPEKGVPEKKAAAPESQTSGLEDILARTFPALSRSPAVNRLRKIAQATRSLVTPSPGMAVFPFPSTSTLPAVRTQTRARSQTVTLPFPNPFASPRPAASSRGGMSESCQQCAADRCMQQAAERARKKPKRRRAGQRKRKKQKLCLDLNSILKLVGSK